MLRMMAHNAASHPDELVFDLLNRGFAETCYDGQFFFDTDHPVEDASGAVRSVSKLLAGAGDPWFLLDASRPIEPLVFQTRVPCTPQQLVRDRDETVFMRDEHLYGIRARVNAGFALRQLAFGSQATLDVANYAAARAAIQAVRYDGGRIMGVVPTLLVVPPSLEAEGREILKVAEIGGTSNVWAGSAELPVSPYLAA